MNGWLFIWLLAGIALLDAFLAVEMAWAPVDDRMTDEERELLERWKHGDT